MGNVSSQEGRFENSRSIVPSTKITGKHDMRVLSDLGSPIEYKLILPHEKSCNAWRPRCYSTTWRAFFRCVLLQISYTNYQTNDGWTSAAVAMQIWYLQYIHVYTHHLRTQHFLNSQQKSLSTCTIKIVGPVFLQHQAQDIPNSIPSSENPPICGAQRNHTSPPEAGWYGDKTRDNEE